MIGIYKITKKENGKCYVGQSNNIDRRFQEHKTKGKESRIPVDIAIQLYGVEAFDFEVLEECSLEELNEREKYWNAFYRSYPDGYNCNPGGDQQSIGSNNGRAKLSEEDVMIIRKAYANHLRQKDVYELFKEKTTFGNFQNVWQGRTWAHVMPEVFTEENKNYYIYENSRGANNPKASFTAEEIIEIRTRYVNESAKQIFEDYKDRVAYQTFQMILWGRYYDELPIYKKKEKEWINI